MEAYILQTLLWITMQILTKFCIYLILNNFYQVSFLGKSILIYLELSEINKLVFVLLVVPIICNIICFFVYDALLKKKYKVS